MADTNLPLALESMAEIREAIGERRPAFFLDLDGTLAPIVSHPELAEVPIRTRAVLTFVARCYLVCFVSGRGLEDLQHKIGLKSVYYAADHGHRIVGPPGSGVDLEVGSEYRDELEAAALQLGRRLALIKGALVEAKGLSLSVHYRLVEETERPFVGRAVAEVAERFPKLEVTSGKLVHELRPPGGWNKGQAILWVLERLGLGPREVCPVCLGDDLTDEDMFVATAGWGVSAFVGHEERPTRAHYRVRDCDEAASLLLALVVPDN